MREPEMIPGCLVDRNQQTTLQRHERYESQGTLNKWSHIPFRRNSGNCQESTTNVIVNDCLHFISFVRLHLRSHGAFLPYLLAAAPYFIIHSMHIYLYIIYVCAICV